eukprot:359245-Chlamydomonas_euryale.AAC.1
MQWRSRLPKPTTVHKVLAVYYLCDAPQLIDYAASLRQSQESQFQIQFLPQTIQRFLQIGRGNACHLCVPEHSLGKQCENAPQNASVLSPEYHITSQRERHAVT